MQIRPGNGAVALTAGLAAAVLLGPLLLRGDPVENARLEANRRHIAEMTEANRLKLLRNYADWQAMSESQQRQWREFGQQLQVQQTSIEPVVDDYYSWLQSIPGYRRDQLRKAKDVQQKVSLVREIVQEELAERVNAPDVTAVDLGGREVQVLTSAELDSVVAALEEGLSSAERSRLVDKQDNELTGVDRHLMVLSQLFRYQGFRQVFDSSATRERVWNALPDRIRESFTNTHERTPGPLLAMTLALSLKVELEQAFRDFPRTPEALRKFYEEQVSPEDQEQLLNMSADDFQNELTRRYFRSQMEQRVNIDVAKVQQFLDPPRGGGDPEGRRFLPRLGGGGGFRREGDGPPEDRPEGGFRGPPDGSERPRRPIEGDRPQDGPRPPRSGEERPPQPPPP